MGQSVNSRGWVVRRQHSHFLTFPRQEEMKMRTFIGFLFCLAALFTFSSGLKCLTCISNAGMDKNCERGQAPSQECVAGEEESLVTYMRFPGNVVVNRKCCAGSDCMNRTIPSGNGQGMFYQTCGCDNCNSFDPSTGVPPHCETQQTVDTVPDAEDWDEEVDEEQDEEEDEEEEQHSGAGSSHSFAVNITPATLLVIYATKMES